MWYSLNEADLMFKEEFQIAESQELPGRGKAQTATPLSLLVLEAEFKSMFSPLLAVKNIFDNIDTFTV